MGQSNYQSEKSNRYHIEGQIHKLTHESEVKDLGPVPYVKVEVFAVDRDTCFWPWLRNRLDLMLDKAVIRIPDLIKHPATHLKPIPELTPVAQFNLDRVTHIFSATTPSAKTSTYSQTNSASTLLRVGETSLIDEQTAHRLDKLTLTSTCAPWDLFPQSFYAKSLMCETVTSCNGSFKCAFDWQPSAAHKGRLGFTAHPDILIKITQVIDNITTEVFLDPYTSTRWNGNCTQLNLALDNKEVCCGNGNGYTPSTGSSIYFTHIGNDEVYQIDQATGLFNNALYDNVAYGSFLNIRGHFGDDLTRSDPAISDSLPYFYYRLSYAKQVSKDDEFQAVDLTLNDIRVDKTTLAGKTHKLGPYHINNEANLYEVRNFNDYYWYKPDQLGTWDSLSAEKNTNTYTLQLELFDKNGTKLNTSSGLVNYRNGAGDGDCSRPMPLPPMLDHCHLTITLDNKEPTVSVSSPGISSRHGVIPWNSTLPLNFTVNVSQANERLQHWHLKYANNMDNNFLTLTERYSNNGLPGSFSNLLISGNDLINDTNNNKTFSVKLWALSHIRNGYGFIYHSQDVDTITIEKSLPCKTA
jgi:hypothetical protein